MSLLTIEPSVESQRATRKFIEDALRGVVDIGSGACRIRLNYPFTPMVENKQDHLVITWNKNPEVDIPGPADPDLIMAKCWPTETRVYLRLSDIRILHAG